MNKDFFSTFDQRKKEFAQRAELEGDPRVEVILGNGRIYVVDRVVEAAENWVHLDVRDIDDEGTLRSIMLPYYQIHHVMLEKPKIAPRAGFGR